MDNQLIFVQARADATLQEPLFAWNFPQRPLLLILPQLQPFPRKAIPSPSILTSTHSV